MPAHVVDVVGQWYREGAENAEREQTGKVQTVVDERAPEKWKRTATCSASCGLQPQPWEATGQPRIATAHLASHHREQFAKPPDSMWDTGLCPGPRSRVRSGTPDHGFCPGHRVMGSVRGPGSRVMSGPPGSRVLQGTSDTKGGRLEVLSITGSSRNQ